MHNLIKAKKLLHENEYTCVLCKDDVVHTSNLRGVKPLVNWYVSSKAQQNALIPKDATACKEASAITNSSTFLGFSAADKVIGKATAFLYILLEVKHIYARVISQSALTLLKQANITVEYDNLVPNIINRKGDGICPFEKAVLNVNDKHKAYELICQKMKEMNIQ